MAAFQQTQWHNDRHNQKESYTNDKADISQSVREMSDQDFKAFLMALLFGALSWSDIDNFPTVWQTGEASFNPRWDKQFLGQSRPDKLSLVLHQQDAWPIRVKHFF